MDYRREARVVVGRKLHEPARLFRLLVDVRVGTADGPEHRRRLPLAAEGTEVLARGDRRDVDYSLVAEVLAEGGAHAIGGGGVVADELIAVEGGDLGRCRRTRGPGLGVDDPLGRV